MKTTMETPAREMNQQRRSVDWRGIAWYVVIAFALSWIIEIVQYTLGIPSAITFNMFGPAIACVLVRLFRREGFTDAGLRLAGQGVRSVWRLYLAAYLIPLVALLVGLGSASLLGLEHWVLPGTFQQLHLPSWLIPIGILAGVTIIPALVMLPTFGEELGWRGYLLPRLLPLGGLKASLLVGLIWGVWHAPLILLDNAAYGGLYPWLGIPMFVVVITSFSIYYTWLRMHSGSIWPTVLTHAVNNAIASFIFIGFTSDNLYLGAPVCVLSLLPFVVVDLWLVLTGRLNFTTNDQEQTTQTLEGALRKLVRR
jgi:uncharacterized protein